MSIPKYPCLWTDLEGDVLLEAVDPGSAEWASVQQSFKRTGMCLKKVDRIQNMFLWFLARQEEPNEQTLFYGTGDMNPDIIISGKDGIDYRYANEGLWGRALYSAYDVRLSNIYSYRLPRANLRCILQVRLITGNTVHLPSDRTLKLWPYTVFIEFTMSIYLLILLTNLSFSKLFVFYCLLLCSFYCVCVCALGKGADVRNY